MTNWLRQAQSIKRTIGSKMTALGLAYVAELVEMAPHWGWLVDLGTWKGASAMMMAKAEPDLPVLTVDNYQEPEDAKTGKGERPEFKAVRGTLFEHTMVLPIRGDTAQAAQEAGPYVMFVLVDADHTAEGVRRDIEAWAPLVVDGGIMAFDDYGSQRWPDVKPTVDELLADWERLGVRGGVAAFRRGRQ